MIPSLVVSDIRSALVEFLASTFALADNEVRDELSRFLHDGSDGIFRGPYLRVRTPFKSVDASWVPPLDWLPADFVPYRHQATAFDRLSTAGGHRPEPTLVTTGTGSGKTECFLFPVLDHCARERAAGRGGVKALILYPMNALASDQAGRIAELIHSEPLLAGITAGLYVGEEGRHSTMGPDHLIDKREVLRSDPPDILLTNYKMLDFLLLRREDRNLWAANDPGTLRYLVLDEFHTYDGAQGTDVAMLLRRLGRSLRMDEPDRPLGAAAPVATSATLGSGPAAIDELCEFATKVFGVPFDRSAVVGETRQTVEEACSSLDYYLPIPDVEELMEVGNDLTAVAAAFCRRELPVDEAEPDQLDVADVVELGDRLLAHPLTRAVLAAVGERARSWPEALAEINARANNWGRASLIKPEDVERALGRYLWLLSLARRKQGDRQRPLFSVEVQLWVREVSRLLRAVSTRPSFRWFDSATPDGGDIDAPLPHQAELPAIYCRRCGLSGWMALQSELGDRLLTKVNTIYTAALNRAPTVRALMLTSPDDPSARWYDPSSHGFTDDPDEFAVPVLATAGEDDARANRCPACGERDSIRFLGLQVASLASVAVNTLFGSPHLEPNERKLLAFTDSVQDASHRASFFSGRTHRFNLRARMADIVRSRESVTLDDLGDELMADAATLRERFEAVPPDLLRDPAVRTVWTDQLDQYGLDVLRRRLGFEADVEFGLRARVGRTLELSRVSVAGVEVDDFDAIADLVAEDLRRLDGDATDDALANIDTYLRGLLERLRLRGGIRNPLLDPYLNDGGRQWFIWGGRPDGLPPFTPGQGRPTFFTSATKGDFDSLSALGTTPTWAVDWAVRTLGVEPAIGRDLNLDAIALLADHSDAVTESASPAGRIWGLERRAIRIWDVDDLDGELTVAGVGCHLCGARHAVPPHLVDRWVGTRCLRYRCVGHYEPDTPREANYYRTLYRSGVRSRVVTAEHTGLLNRSQREHLEQAFKDGTAPDAPNVITATPTLELGIDIGDLSAVMLTSVPRNPASYIQRVGRAGRLSGNSLITTFVRTDTHGLYYLSDPEAMISGDVRPPNCYLDAVETLQRQYIAYLIDRMADLTIDADPLPREIQPLMKAGLDDGSILRRLVDASMLEPAHVDHFLGLFDPLLAASTASRLREFAAGGIEPFLKDAIETWRSADRDLGLRRTRLTGAIDRLEELAHRSADDDEQLGSLRGQRSAIISLLRHHRNEYALSALERLGVLPNFLLLGDTATLRATLWSSEAAGGFHTETFEYTRTANLALREFAPGNSFYAVGHRHVVDALEIGTADEPLYEAWRLCPECGYGAIEPEGEPPASCPRCGSIGIGDTGARHTLLRLRTALASSSEEAARVYDESDERQRGRYDVMTTIDVDPAHVSEAWRLKERAFGAEMSGVTHLRSVNLGFTERRGEQLPIGGDERHVTGFTVCRYCGAVSDVRDDRNGSRPERLHQGWCKVRSGSVTALWDHVLLFHQLTTEAVRILLPVSMFEVDERLASFKGALLLGLREDFGGDPDHLEVARSELPNRGGQGRRRFLVLYDRVPGGTGYLARLADPDRMRQILQAARRVVSQCPCRSEGRPACHRCLLGVVDRNEYEFVRRDLALELLDDLLDDWDTEHIDTVSGIDIGKVEESELERRFKVAIRNWVDHPENDDVTVTSVPGHNGRDAFEMYFTYQGQSIRYRVDEQEGLSTTPSTQPDFLIRRQDDKAPDIAVYLDGYQFHASPDINNLADDAAKRAGVRESGRLVWNLTWDDVATFDKTVQGETLKAPRPRPLMGGSARQRAMRLHNARDGEYDFDAVSQNPMTLLLDYLRRPDAKQWERLALSAVGGAFADADGPHPIPPDDIASTVGAAAAGSFDWPGPDDSPRALGARWTTVNGHHLTLLLAADDPNAERWTVISAIPDRAVDVESAQHVGRWHDWLQWANLLQFLDGPGRDAVVSATTQAGSLSLDNLWLVDSTAAAGLAEVPTPGVAVAPAEEPLVATELTDDQEEELDLILDDAVRALVGEVLAAGAPDFVAGYETDQGVIEAAWPDLRVAVLSDGETIDADGWDARPVSDWTADALLLATREQR